jgi:hypothetical protein
MDKITLTITAAQWAEISAGLNERPMKSALAVLQACQAQIDEQIAAHQLLLAQPKAPPLPAGIIGYTSHTPLGNGTRAA